MKKEYNGIINKEPFPPKDIDLYSGEPIPVPYLDNPPSVIDITVGRQLFVDDFLIEKADGVKVVQHNPIKRKEPVLVPETDAEKKFGMHFVGTNSGGLIYDGKKTKLYYQGSWLGQLCLAESDDGINFTRPCVKNGDNVVLNCDLVEFGKDGIEFNELTDEQFDELAKSVRACKSEDDMRKIKPHIFRMDSGTVIYDENSEEERYKFYYRNPGVPFPAYLATSPDGINWNKFNITPVVEDRSTAFYNPFRNKWVYSIRWWYRELDGKDGKKDIGRSRNYAESDNFLDNYKKEDQVMWYTADKLELEDENLKIKPQIYNIDAVAYESLMVGIAISFKGPDNITCLSQSRPKTNDLCLMFSRDGFHWSRLTREPFIKASRDENLWDNGYLMSVGGLFAVDDDEIRVYYTGTQGDSKKPYDPWLTGMHANGSIGLATLRRDGFASISGKGSFVTRKLIFTENRDRLRVNFKGKVKCEIYLDGKIYASGEAEGDFVSREILSGLSELKNKEITIKFTLDGDLYSFWFTDSTGKAYGYINQRKEI